MSTSSKVLPLKQLGHLKEADAVLCHGTFDVVHPGHLDHLRQARKMGDCLVVSITNDDFIHKGPGRPLFDAKQRADFLAALDIVDYVTVVNGPTAIDAIERIQPKHYVKGEDYKGRTTSTFLAEMEAVNKLGGTVRFTDGILGSSSAIVNTIRELPDELVAIRNQFTLKDVYDWLERVSNVSVMCVGEPIIDEYIYVEPAAKSPKHDLITYVPKNEEKYWGGMLACLRHLKSFCWNVYDCEGWIKPIIKQRFVDKVYGQKLFSAAYQFEENQPTTWRPERFKEVDMLLVTDFGHGLIDQKRADNLSDEAPYLALTVQANSLNWGYNLLTKYKKADYVVIDEPELRLASQDHYSPVDKLMKAQYDRMGLSYMGVTQGHQGATVYDGETFVHLPTLTSKVVDRIGAGDAFFSVTAPLAYLKAPPELLCLIGNAAGGLQVSWMGNAEAVTKKALEKVLKGVLA